MSKPSRTTLLLQAMADQIAALTGEVADLRMRVEELEGGSDESKATHYLDGAPM